MKKRIIIFFCLLISFIASNLNKESFIIKVDLLVPILFTLLGLCITSYTFIYGPISNILARFNFKLSDKKKLQTLLKSFEEDMLVIFFIIIGIIFLDLIKNIDFPIIKDLLNLDVKIIVIYSFKMNILNLLISFGSCMSFYALYDLMRATFNILKESFDI